MAIASGLLALIIGAALISGAELGSLDLAAQHTELVAQDGDLDVLGVLASQAPEQDADAPACHEVRKDSAIGRLSPTRVLAAQHPSRGF
jgi:hypothetical protein